MSDTPVCQQCKLRPPSRKGRPYCSKACSNRARLVPLSERFLRYYRPGDPAECWPWLGSTDRDGYGVIGDERQRQLRAHRVSYERFHGVVVPAASYVLHACDNPVCVNPHHLRLGSNAENMADKTAKMRQPHGEGHWKARLTERDVRAIRSAYPSRTAPELAAQYGLTVQGIMAVVNRKLWKHVQ
jgi:hypothetical protein